MYRQSEKNLLNSNISPSCPYNMVNFGPLAAEIVSLVWGTQQIYRAFASWQLYCTVLQEWASAKLCDVEQRAPPIFGSAAITSAHILVCWIFPYGLALFLQQTRRQISRSARNKQVAKFPLLFDILWRLSGHLGGRLKRHHYHHRRRHHHHLRIYAAPITEWTVLQYCSSP